jgi:hypothetical protein
MAVAKKYCKYTSRPIRKGFDRYGFAIDGLKSFVRPSDPGLEPGQLPINKGDDSEW